MSNKLLSIKLQKDIPRALSIFHPHSMTTRKYLSFFDDVDEFRMLTNIEELIRQEWSIRRPYGAAMENSFYVWVA